MTTQTLSSRAIIGTFYQHLEQDAGQVGLITYRCYFTVIKAVKPMPG